MWIFNCAEGWHTPLAVVQVCVFMRVANENMKQDESGKEKTSQKVYMEIPVLNRVVQGLP